MKKLAALLLCGALALLAACGRHDTGGTTATTTTKTTTEPTTLADDDAQYRAARETAAAALTAALREPEPDIEKLRELLPAYYSGGTYWELWFMESFQKPSELDQDKLFLSILFLIKSAGELTAEIPAEKIEVFSKRILGEFPFEHRSSKFANYRDGVYEIAGMGFDVSYSYRLVDFAQTKPGAFTFTLDVFEHAGGNEEAVQTAQLTLTARLQDDPLFPLLYTSCVRKDFPQD